MRRASFAQPNPLPHAVPPCESHGQAVTDLWFDYKKKTDLSPLRSSSCSLKCGRKTLPPAVPAPSRTCFPSFPLPAPHPSCVLVVSQAKYGVPHAHSYGVLLPPSSPSQCCASAFMPRQVLVPTQPASPPCPVGGAASPF
jgi:hypothetical protein